MRSSKSRSRSKSNRQRSPMGNIVNRVFDSSGPEGKVRGTPQQIIDKYQTLARDAQLSNDRVAAENFLQHSEHYARMLSEAQREMEAQRQNQGGQSSGDQPRQDGDRDDGGNDGRSDGRSDGRNDPRSDSRQDGRRGNRNDRGESGDDRGGDDRPAPQPQMDRREDRRGGQRPDRGDRGDRGQGASDVIDVDAGESSGLVETPEMRGNPAAPDAGAAPAPQPKQRRPRKPKAEGTPPTDDAPKPSEAAE